MASYGWTIEQTVEITLPQATLLFSAMGRHPTVPAMLGAIFGGKDKQMENALGKLGTVKATGAGADFLRSLGIADPEAS